MPSISERKSVESFARLLMRRVRHISSNAIVAGIAFLTASLLLASCLSNHEDDQGGSGSDVRLAGRVLDADNKGVSGIVVALSQNGFADTTNAEGEYTINGDLNVQGTDDDVLDTLVFMQNEQEFASLPVTSWVADLPDLRIVQRDISGKLLGGAADIARVEAVISGVGIPENRPVVIELFHFSLTSTYTGFAYFRGTTGVVNYAVYVRVLDSLGRMTGRSPLVEFQSNAGDIPVPDFDPGNAIPMAFAGNDTASRVNATFLLRGKVADSFDGTVAKWEWSVGGIVFVETSSSDTSIVLPPIRTPNYMCILRATDDDGNVAMDTMIINVLNDDPTVSGMRDTTVSINDSVNLVYTISASDPEGVKWYLWDIDGDGVNEDTTLTNTVAFSFFSSIPDVRRVIVTVWDIFDGVSRDTAIVSVVQDKPVPVILGTSTAKILTPVTLSAQVTQQFGHVVMYKWDDGKTLGWDDSSSSMTQFSVTYQAKGNYATRLYVRDDDGSVDSVSRSISVTNDNPVVSGMPDTIIATGSSITFTVTATDPEGISRYLWDMNGDGIFEDTTSTNVQSHAYPSAPGLTRSIVRVEDFFDGVTLDTAKVFVHTFAPWTTSALNLAANSIVWNGTKFVAVGYGGDTFYSTDGLAWLQGVRTDDASHIMSITWTGSRFVAATSSSTNTIISSLDGISWTTLASAPSDLSNYVAWINGQLIWSSFNGAFRTSVDGVNWVTHSQSPGRINSAVWDGKQMVVVGIGGAIHTSSDGSSWTARPSGTSANLNSIAWTGSGLVAVGNGGEILTSLNAVNWKKQSLGVSDSLHSVAWTGKECVAVGNRVGGGGVVLVSPDPECQIWSHRASGLSIPLRSVAGNEARTVAAGWVGVATSP